MAKIKLRQYQLMQLELETAITNAIHEIVKKYNYKDVTHLYVADCLLNIARKNINEEVKEEIKD